MRRLPTTLLILTALLSSCTKDEQTTTASNPASQPDAAAASRDSGTEEGAGKQQISSELADALKQGKAENKLVMVELFDVECPYCDLVQETIEDEDVAKELEDVIHIQMVPSDEAFITAFDLDLSPSFLFFKPGGGHLAPYLRGYRSPEVFLAEVRNYKLRMAGKDTLPVPDDEDPSAGKG